MGETKKRKAEIKKGGAYNLTSGGISSYLKDRLMIIIVLMLVACNTWGEEESIILLHADRAIYKKDEVVLEGRVELKFRDTYLRAAYVRFNQENNMLQAKGGIILEDKEKRIYGHELSYNIEEKRGIMWNARTKIKDTYYSGESIEILGEGRFILNNCAFHTCNLENPHYRLRAKRVEVKTGDRLQARSLWLDVGGIPLFYFPIYNRNLKRREERRLDIKTGYNVVSGFYAKGRYGYMLRNHSGKILCDYFQKKGWGKGISHKYLIGKSGKGEIDLYHIEDKATNRSRWIATSNYYQEFSPNTTCGMKIDFLSDELVRRRYKGEWSTQSKLESYLHITQNKERYILRGLLYRKDELEEGRFIKKEEDLPRLTLQSKRLGIGRSPFYYRFGLELGREWRYEDREHNNFLKGDLSILGKISPSRWVTCSPNIGVTGEWKKRLIKGSYYTDFSIRVKPHPFLDVDLKHSFKGELREKGDITKNRLKGKVMVMPLKGFKTGVGSEYDLKEEEFKPIRGEIRITPNKSINLQFRSSYDTEEARFSKIGAFLKGHHKALFDIAVRYSKYLITRSEILKWKIGLNLVEALKLKLKLEGGYDLKLGRFKWCEYSLYRDLHCLKLSANFREKESLIEGGEPEREFGINIGIKALP